MLQAPEQGEREVRFQVPFVEFVEHDNACAAKVRVGKQAASKDAFGEKSEAGLGPSELLEANLVADGIPDSLSTFLGDATRRHASSDAARLQDENRSKSGGFQCSGNACGLPCPRSGFDHKVGMHAEGCDDLRDQRIHRQRRWFQL